MTGGGEAFAFWVLGPLAVLGGLGLVFARKAVHAALGMALAMVIMGIFYIVQGAPFLGVVQVFVYTGAVMMLFLFVLMLVGVDSSDSVVETLKGQRVAALLLTLGLGGLLMAVVARADISEDVRDKGMADLEATNGTVGNITAMAWKIFGQYVWVFEITSALLITAALGAMVLAHRERIGKRVTQAELAARRVKDNQYVAGLPAPGVYARHNAVDTPALLPDGTPSQLSVSRVLVARDQVATADGFKDVDRFIEQEIEEGRAK